MISAYSSCMNTLCWSLEHKKMRGEETRRKNAFGQFHPCRLEIESMSTCDFIIDFTINSTQYNSNRYNIDSGRSPLLQANMKEITKFRGIRIIFIPCCVGFISYPFISIPKITLIGTKSSQQEHWTQNKLNITSSIILTSQISLEYSPRSRRDYKVPFAA